MGTRLRAPRRKKARKPRRIKAIAWSASELAAWKWPSILLPSQWAETNRMLSATMSAEPGPWRVEKSGSGWRVTRSELDGTSYWLVEESAIRARDALNESWKAKP